MKRGDIIRRVTNSGIFVGGYIMLTEWKNNMWHGSYLTEPQTTFPVDMDHFRVLKVAHLRVSKKNFDKILYWNISICIHEMTPKWEDAMNGKYDLIRLYDAKRSMYFSHCEFAKIIARDGFKYIPHVKIYLTTRIL